jgi:hypothetical protein
MSPSELSQKYGVAEPIVLALADLSRPLRRALAGILEAESAQLQFTLNSAIINMNRGDTLAKRLNIALDAVQTMLEPVDNFMRQTHLDNVASTSPEIATILQQATNQIAIKVPASAASQLVGFNGFDLFNGINSYSDLRNKMYELQFRVVRATALSTYSQKAVTVTTNLLKQVNAYIAILYILGT